MSTSRIPHSKPLFFAYMRKTNNYLLAIISGVANWVRMNVLGLEQTAWAGFAAQAATLELQYANKADRSETLTMAIEGLIGQVHLFDHTGHMLDRIAAQHPSIALLADYTTFNITHNLPVPHTGAATERKVATENLVYFSLKNGAAAQIICHCKPDAADKRSHLLKDFNVEIFYVIEAQKAAMPDVTVLIEHEVFSKAHFTLDLSGNSGQKLFIGMRWRHKTNPALNGSVGAIQSITIS